MDSYEWNKIAGAVLFALLVAFGLSIFSELILETEAPEPPGYVIATAESGQQQEQEEEKPIAVLLASADAGAGETAARKCLACHTFGEGEANKVGPNLWGVVMRPIASHEGYTYSDAMHAFAEDNGNWTYENLNTFLTNPAAAVPQTKMTFAGLKNDSERANVIAYLRTLSANPEPLPEVTTMGEQPPGAEEPVPAEDVGAEAAAGEEPQAESMQPQAEEAAPAEEPQPAEEAQPAEEEQGAMEPAAEEDAAAAAEAPAAEEPAMAAEEPAPAAEEPAMATEQPAPAAEEPAMAAEQPAPAAEEPAMAAEEPAPAAEEPAMAAEEPAPADGEQQMAAAEAPAAETPTAMPTGDAAAGKNFARRCLACHSFDQDGPNKVGPHLFGVFGSHVASVQDFTYSEAMTSFSEGGTKVWDAATLDTYLTDPRKVVPGTKMIFPGIKSETDRQNVVAYLATLTP